MIHHRELVGKKKQEIIDWLLANPVFTPDSKMVQRLRVSLGKLSVCDLGNLKLLLELKESRDNALPGPETVETSTAQES